MKVESIQSFDITFDNPDGVYFAGQEVTGLITLDLSEEEKVNEILMELKGKAKSYWTKHSGRARKHWSDSEPYFCEQFNTQYTKTFGTAKERTLPKGRHQIPFSYQLPKNLPSSFEGEFGHIRFTCKATLERHTWDHDIVTQRAFSVVGIEDMNEDTRARDPIRLENSNFDIRFCCQRKGTMSLWLTLPKSGYTPGEDVLLSAEVRNDSTKTMRYSCARIKQHITYRAKTFSGHEKVKEVSKIIVSKEKGKIPPGSTQKWENDKLPVPPIPPKLVRCKIIDISYTMEFEVDPGIVVMSPILIGTIPLMDDSTTATGAKTKDGQSIGSSSDVIRRNDESATAANNGAAEDSSAPLLSKTTGGVQGGDSTGSCDLENVTVTLTDADGQTSTVEPSTSANSSEKVVTIDSGSGTTKTITSTTTTTTAATHNNVVNNVNNDPTKNTAEKVQEQQQEDIEIDEDDLRPRRRVRLPSSVLSELYPGLVAPTFEECLFGKVTIDSSGGGGGDTSKGVGGDETETTEFGQFKFAPKYPCYRRAAGHNCHPAAGFTTPSSMNPLKTAASKLSGKITTSSSIGKSVMNTTIKTTSTTTSGSKNSILTSESSTTKKHHAPSSSATTNTQDSLSNSSSVTITTLSKTGGGN